MISYPAQIVERFGRYEGVAHLASRPGVELWKAWDPYLERFVIVVTLPGLAQEELYRAGADMESLLEARLGRKPSKRQILDFAPPSAEAAAFFVVEYAGVPLSHGKLLKD